MSTSTACGGPTYATRDAPARRALADCCKRRPTARDQKRNACCTNILREARITGWKANYRVGDYRVDVGFPGPKVAIEVDGFAFHSGVDEFQIDRFRQNGIVLLKWQVLRFTWLDLTEYPQRVLAMIQAAISAR